MNNLSKKYVFAKKRRMMGILKKKKRRYSVRQNEGIKRASESNEISFHSIFSHHVTKRALHFHPYSISHFTLHFSLQFSTIHSKHLCSSHLYLYSRGTWTWKERDEYSFLGMNVKWKLWALPSINIHLEHFVSMFYCAGTISPSTLSLSPSYSLSPSFFHSLNWQTKICNSCINT